MTIHETVAALDAGPIAAQEPFRSGRTTTPAPSSLRAAEVAAALLDAYFRRPSFVPQPAEGATYAEKIGPSDRELDLGDPVDAWRRVRALSPHIGAWAVLARSPCHRLAGATRGRRLRPRRGAAGGAAAHELRGVPARAPPVTAPARRCGIPGRPARLRGRGVRRPGARVGRAPDSTRATVPSRSGSPTGPFSVRRTIDHGIDALGEPTGRRARPARPRGACGSQATSSPGARHLRTPSSTTRSSSCARPGCRARRASRTPSPVGSPTGFTALVASLPPGPLAESYPDWIYEIWVRDFGEEEALDLMRAQNEPAELVVRSATSGGRRRPTSPAPTGSSAGSFDERGRGQDLAEPGLAARRARARARATASAILDACAAPGAKATMLRGAGHRGRAPPRPRPRARGERPAARGDERPRRQCRRARARRDRGSTARSSMRPAPASACSRGGPTCAGARRPLPDLQLELLQRRRRADAGRAAPSLYSVCTLNADENEAVVDAVGPRAGAARRGVAAVRASEAARVPADDAAPARHLRASSSPASASESQCASLDSPAIALDRASATPQGSSHPAADRTRDSASSERRVAQMHDPSGRPGQREDGSTRRRTARISSGQRPIPRRRAAVDARDKRSR